MPTGDERAGQRSERLAPALITVIFLLVGMLYGAIVPPLEGFDAESYYRGVTYVRTRQPLPLIDRESGRFSYEVIVQPPLYFLTAALAGLPFPPDAENRFAIASRNAYFGDFSDRQSVTLPTASWEQLAPLQAARLVSLLCGLATVLLTWRLVRLWWPAAPPAALAAAAFTGLNPQFLFSSVAISNDAMNAAACALVVLLASDALLKRRAARFWLLVGGAAGIALLVKYSSLLTAAPVALLWLVLWRQRGGQTALRALLWALAGLAATAGWWYLRNWLLYGELLPLETLARTLTTLERAEPFTWAKTAGYIPWLAAGYWGVFVRIIAPEPYLLLTRSLWAATALGALLWWRRSGDPLRLALGMALLWAAVSWAAVLHWTRTVDFGEQGRLLHMAAPGFALLAVAGLAGWAPLRWQRALWTGLILLMGGLATAMLLLLHDRYAPPAALSADSVPPRPIAARFAGGMELLGVDLPAGAAAAPGEPLLVTLYLRASSVITTDYTLFLHLADGENRLLAQFDGPPGNRPPGGRHPTRQWRPGEIFADTYLLPVTEFAGAGLGQLSLGFYPKGRPNERTELIDAAGNPLGDRVVVAAVRLQPDPAHAPDAAAPPLSRWAGGIDLNSATLTRTVEGEPVGVQLEWGAVAPIQRNYTIFVQLLDADNQLLAQRDVQPQNGGWPTSTWRSGDRISDVIQWQPTGRPWQKLILGLYDEQGMRLPLAAGGDFLVLDEQK